MQSLAEVLSGRGWRLTGSDLFPSSGCARPLFTRLHVGHAANNVATDVAWLIHSAAVEDANPELQAARLRGIRTSSYPQALGELMAQAQQGVAIAGTHGKSTTTAMLAQILIAAGRDPTVVLGATPLGWRSGGRPGSNKIFLAEACEYRCSFWNLRPHAAVVLNIEPDHFDCFPQTGDVTRAFAGFADRVVPGGLLMLNADCPAARAMVALMPDCRIVQFSTNEAAPGAWHAARIESLHGCPCFELRHRGLALARICLQVPGRHQVTNALAAAALAIELGVAPEPACQALRRFVGVQRRLENLGTFGGVTVIDDYAHHPTEIRASLAAVREAFPHRRLVCVFQPHQASRLTRLLDEFASSLHNADALVVTEVFRARESAPAPREAKAADLVARLQRQGSDATYKASPKDILHHLKLHLCPADVLLTLGAGDLSQTVTHELVERSRIDGAGQRTAGAANLAARGRAGRILRRAADRR